MRIKTTEDLKKFAESRGYKVKSIKVFKNGHFRIAYSTSEFKAISWNEFAFKKLTVQDADKLFPILESKEA